MAITLNDDLRKLTSALIPPIWIHFGDLFPSLHQCCSNSELLFAGSGLESGGHYMATEGGTLLSNSQLRPGGGARGVSGDRMQLNTGLHRGPHLTTDREFKVRGLINCEGLRVCFTMWNHFIIYKRPPLRLFMDAGALKQRSFQLQEHVAQ